MDGQEKGDKEETHFEVGGRGNKESSHQVYDNFSKMGTKVEEQSGQEVGWQLEVCLGMVLLAL